MVRIELEQISKRYRREWIFKKLDYTFVSGKRYAILGHNGSGKSTLLRILSGHLTPSRGQISFWKDDQSVSKDLAYQLVSFAGPYIELVEEFTLQELLHFHLRFKSLQDGLTEKDVLDLLSLPKARQKEIRHFSSGMKQRLKLILALCSDSPILLLDEPTSNLDSQGVSWYHELIERFSHDRLLIVASNVEDDVRFCEESLVVEEFK